MKMWLVIFFSILSLVGCRTDEMPIVENPGHDMYFPPISGVAWDTMTTAQLGWNQSAITSLKNYLSDKNTKSFMILVNGKIAMEEYFNGHSPSSSWEWNSAGKTLVSMTTGIAQQEGLLDINHAASDYLGTSWTSMSADKEKLITVRHLLTMTAGNDDTKQFIIKNNLTYVTDAGTRWAYSNVFQKLIDIVAQASHRSFENYFSEKLKNKIGMEGYWNFGIIYTIYHSTTRSMARFGLLALNHGKWQNEQIINPTFYTESTTTSQNINPSYGYLWWLNGKSSYMLPRSQTVFSNTLIPNAPADMYAAMGAADQRIYVIPSKKMVIVRMGDASDPINPGFALSGFDNILWEKINNVIK